MKKGIILTIAANVMWGLLPAYWKLLKSVPPIEIICHRVIWSFLFLAFLVTLRRNWLPIRTKLRQRKTLAIFLATSAIIAGNWLLYVWAVNSGHVVASSLGYFIYPLVGVLLARVFLGEKLNPLQAAATALAGGGVLYLTWSHGAFPWISVALALTFGFYSLLRKIGSLNSLEGLTFETAVLSLPALTWLFLVESRGTGAFGHSGTTTVLLLLTGVITAYPLLLFLQATRLIRLSTVAFLHYISPSLQFVLGVFVYREPFSAARLTGFIIIWVALALYSYDLLTTGGARADAAA